MEKKIKNLINEIVVGKEKSLLKLKKLYQGFFKGKTQQELDKVNQKFLKSLRDSYDIITKKKKLTEIDKSYLDYLFNKPLSKYISLEIETDINELKLKILARIICDEQLSRRTFNQKEVDKFIAFVGWLWIYNDFHEEITLKSKDKDLFVNISFWGYEKDEIPEINVFASGDKKYNLFFEKIQRALK